MENKFNKLLMVIVGVGVIVLIFKIKQGWALKQKLKQQQRELSLLNKKVSYHKQQLKKFNYNLQVSRQTQTKLLAELRQIAAGLKLKVTNLAPQVKRKHKHAIEYPLSVTAEGSYQKLVKFLKELEQLNWIIEIKTVELTAVEAKLKSHFSVAVYTIQDSDEK